MHINPIYHRNCLKFNKFFWALTLFVIGELKLTREFTTILDPVLDGNGILILGQEQDSFGGGFDKFQSLSGKISQFNMYSRYKYS